MITSAVKWEPLLCFNFCILFPSFWNFSYFSINTIWITSTVASAGLWRGILKPLFIVKERRVISHGIEPWFFPTMSECVLCAKTFSSHWILIENNKYLCIVLLSHYKSLFVHYYLRVWIFVLQLLDILNWFGWCTRDAFSIDVLAEGECFSRPLVCSINLY